MNTKRESQTILSLEQLRAVESGIIETGSDFEDLEGVCCTESTLWHPYFGGEGDSGDYDFE